MRSIFLLLGVCVLLAAHALPCTAGQRKVIVIVANRLILDDLLDNRLANIQKMIRNGSVGLISPNCIGYKGECGVMLTANAGASAAGGWFCWEFYDSYELTRDGVSAGDVYEARTGIKAPEGSAVFLGLGPALRVNEAFDSNLRLGALGDLLENMGIKTAVIGNADLYPDRFDRSAAVLAMDSTGIIDLGSLRTKYDKHFYKNLNDIINNAGYIVIYFGKTAILDDSRISYSDSAFAREKCKIMRELDGLIGRLMLHSKYQGDRLILASFSPTVEAVGKRLTPIVIYPSLSASVLVSPTTRTPGIIAASDFAPTILRLFNSGNGSEAISQIEGIVGRPAFAVNVENRIEHLKRIDDTVNVQYALMVPMLWSFTILGALSFGIAGLLIVFPGRANRINISIIKACLIIAACAPLAMLLAAVKSANLVDYVVATIIALAALAILSFAFGHRISKWVGYDVGPVLFAFALTVIAILLDIFYGGFLSKYAQPSCAQISGMRFYGIGNEYGGSLIVMTAIVALFAGGGANRSFLTRWIAIAIMAFITFVLVHGELGANYGATMAASVTFGLIGISIWRGKYGARHIFLFLLSGIAIVVGAALIEVKLSGIASSHAGRAAGLTESLGLNYALTLVGRKILFNIYILGSRHGTNAILTFTPFIALWFFGVRKRLKEVLAKEDGIVAGLKAVAVGSVVGFLMNDTGLVLSGIMLTMTVLAILYLLLSFQNGQTKSVAGCSEEMKCRG